MQVASVSRVNFSFTLFASWNHKYKTSLGSLELMRSASNGQIFEPIEPLKVKRQKLRLAVSCE